MRFQHNEAIWRDFPLLAAGAVVIQCETSDRDVARHTQRFLDRADVRLRRSSESELPEIQAWRRAFAQIGLKPTQYRCASEALLRRYRKDKTLPHIHPLVDLCNAASVAYAIPVARASNPPSQPPKSQPMRCRPEGWGGSPTGCFAARRRCSGLLGPNQVQPFDRLSTAHDPHF
jgi:hypothetical protein